MKFSEVRSLLYEVFTDVLGLSPTLDIPKSNRGLDVIPNSFAIGPFTATARSEPLRGFYPIILQWRFSGRTPFNTLPMPAVESFMIDIGVQLPCNTDASFSLGESDISVFRTEDNQDWIIALNMVVEVSLFWEPEANYEPLSTLASVDFSPPTEILNHVNPD